MIKKQLFRNILWGFKNWMLSKMNLKSQLSSGITIKIENYADWIIFNDIFVEGEYDLAIKYALNSAENRRCLKFLDLGANVGFFTLRIADLILKSENKSTDFEVVMIEGSRQVYHELRSRLMNESILNNKVKIVHGLVGERQGKGKIIESAFHVTNSVISDNNFSGTEVDYLDVMELYQEKDEIDLLKCDIEGAEQLFIENYQEFLSKKVKSAIFEFHHDKCNTDKCVKLLKNLGFTNHQKLRECSIFSVDFFWK